MGTQVDAILCSGLIAPQQLTKMEHQLKRIDQTRGTKQAELVLNKFLEGLRMSNWFESAPLARGPGLAKALEALLDKANAQVHDTHQGRPLNDVSLSRILVVTPTARHLEGPFSERSNSILRQYGHASDHFIRVRWREEDHSTYFVGNDWDVGEFLHRAVKPIFTKDIIVGGRSYQFLVSTASGVREQTAVFVTPFEVDGVRYDADKIRSQMGTFAKTERMPAKWMARLGQNFSTSKFGADLSAAEVGAVEPDIAPQLGRGRQSPWVFTDGCGTISPLLADEIERRMVAQLSEYDRRRQVSSTCYQIRLGGAKGMVSIDPTLAGRWVVVRESMVKFEAAGPLTLNIANQFGLPSPLFTNRSLIQILEALGVDKDAFLDVERAAISETHRARTSTEGMVTLLDKMNLASGARLSSTLAWLAPLLPAQQTEAIQDDFIQHAVNLAVVHSLREIKFRSRLPLPGCWTLVGVADEEPGGFLAPNEIYACVHEPGKEPVYLEGEVVITRSPCIHPGDVRKVRAIGKLPPGLAPRIAAQRNCVVFSVRGGRPLPSMLGGGDLDGDMYQVITITSLFPKRVVPAAEYTAAKPRELGRPSTVKDVAEFLIEHTIMSCVGRITVNHTHLADYKYNGVFSADCLELARNL